MSNLKITLEFDEETVRLIEACAKWRALSSAELAKAYVEDWLDIDYPESQGRLTRRGMHRDGPITLDKKTLEETSQNWRDELGIARLQPRADQ